jgi:hypothetical protein
MRPWDIDHGLLFDKCDKELLSSAKPFLRYMKMTSRIRISRLRETRQAGTLLEQTLRKT